MCGDGCIFVPMTRMKRPRAFRRDDALSIRLPGEDKDRLTRMAAQKRRDRSNLALEYICNGLATDEAGTKRITTER